MVHLLCNNLHKAYTIHKLSSIKEVIKITAALESKGTGTCKIDLDCGVQPPIQAPISSNSLLMCQIYFASVKITQAIQLFDTRVVREQPHISR